MITKSLTNTSSVSEKKSSANSCFTLLMEIISKGTDKGLFIIRAVLIDLHKAFNTTDHQTLFKQMRCVGFSE